MEEELHDHDRGLGFDLSTLIARRRLFTMVAGAGLAAVVASCSSDGKASSTTAAASPTTPATDAVASTAPATTAATPVTAASASATAVSSTDVLQTIPE